MNQDRFSLIEIETLPLSMPRNWKENMVLELSSNSTWLSVEVGCLAFDTFHVQ